MIYIDPPYNTGNDFIYRDDFAQDKSEYQKTTHQIDEEGNHLVTNKETNGRFHSDWLSMIYPRLKLARDFLTQDGAIFVSCDENEQPRLRLIMDELFGMHNFIADIVWAAGMKNDSRFISVSHEYIVCYVRNKNYLIENNISWKEHKEGLGKIYAQHKRLKGIYGTDYTAMTKEMKIWYKNLSQSNPSKKHKNYTYIDEKGIYCLDNISWPGGGGPRYEVLHPRTGKPVTIPSPGWRISDPKKMSQLIQENKVHFGENETRIPSFKRYLHEHENQVPYSVFKQSGSAVINRLRNLMGGDYFNHPKDEIILQKLIALVTANSSNDIVLDFFAGSGSTAHALMQLNAEDGGNRSFILVQIDEKCNEKSTAFKVGYHSIADIAKERMRRAGQKILASKVHDEWQKDIGFRVLKIDSSNMIDVHRAPDVMQQKLLYSYIDNIKPDRSEEDLLFQAMQTRGINLALPITQIVIQEKTVYFVDDNVLAACFDRTGGVDENFINILIKQKSSLLCAVFCDEGFKDDATKINVENLCKLYVPNVELCLI
jgi:adenine-specific DNA-methyltransferase